MGAFARLEVKLGQTDASGRRERRRLRRKVSKPVEPRPEECCGNDCQLCVWVVYWEQLQDWEAQQRQEAEAAASAEAAGSKDEAHRA